MRDPVMKVTRTVRLMSLSFLMLVAACDRPAPTASSERPTLRASTIPAQRNRIYQTPDDRFAELADRVPGFGGVYYDSEGRLNIHLKYPQIFPAARPVITAFLGRGLKDFARLAKLNYDVANARVRKGTYDFRELLTWYKSKVVPVAARTQGLTSSGIDDRANRIVLRVAQASQVGAVQERVSVLGLPPNAIDVRVGAVATPESDTLTTEIRPILGGASIEVWNTYPDSAGCTLGFNLAPWVGGELDTTRYAVTAGHCAKPRFTVYSGTEMYQPIRYANVAVEVVDPPTFTDTLTDRCPSGKQCRFSDAALFKYYSASTADQGRVALPGSGSIIYSSTVSISEIYTPILGSPVDMVGKSSGHTSGEIVDICDDWPLPNTNIVYICQVTADYGSTGGDSGSPIIEPLGGGQAFAIGIHVASAPRFSLLSAALWEIYMANQSLGVLDPVYNPSSAPDPPDEPPAYQPLVVTIGGPATVGPNNYTCSVWAAVVEGGVSSFQYSWSGLFTGTEGFVSGTVPPQGGMLEVYVEDANGRVGIAQLQITYDPNNTDWCE